LETEGLQHEVWKYSDTGKCTGVVTRLNVQCGIDCSTAVEFNTAIMLVLLMGCWDFTGAGAVAVLVGKQEGEEWGSFT